MYTEKILLKRILKSIRNIELEVRKTNKKLEKVGA